MARRDRTQSHAMAIRIIRRFRLGGLTLLATWALSGCDSVSCPSNTCAGDTLRWCQEDCKFTCSAVDLSSGTNDCAAEGEICVENNGTASCVAPGAAACDGTGSSHRVSCHGDELVIEYCMAVGYFMLYTEDCPEFYGINGDSACMEANETAACVDPAAIPCTPGTRVASCDGNFALNASCSAVGYATEIHEQDCERTTCTFDAYGQAVCPW
jgi:hypothetical protein